MKRFLARICVRITGFKPSRIREWRTLVRDEAKTLGWRAIAVSLLAGALRLGGVSRSRWRRRLRHGCGKCPVYDRARRACRKRGLGCGCWMPAKALVGDPAKACWRVGVGDSVPAFA